jgi:hypothetical protein
MRELVGLITAAALAVAGPACMQRLQRKVGPTLQTVDMAAPYLKAHMRDGDVYILHKWTIDEPGRAVIGGGRQLGADRRVIREAGPGGFTIKFADVALYETNTVITSPGVTAMAILSGISVGITVACLSNPKACFGSCPTFYATSDDGRSVLQAEGFSDAIAPSLEKHDIDALWRTTGAPGPITIRMTNEAYETHVVKQADLLAVARPAGGRVLATDDRLWLASAVTAPLACTAPEGACLEPLRAVDGAERTSLTDGKDLAARETIELAFAPTAGGQAAIVIAARQSLVTTFLLYQGLSYLGTRAGAWFAAFERGEPAARLGGRALDGILGGVEVQIERDGAWQTVGQAYETGPLATDVHLVMLPAGVTGERVRLRLPMGGWRIDHVALATITGEATPIRIAPSRIRGEVGPEFAGGRVPATDFPIVTLPGDVYDLSYELPAGGEYELFLDSRGYYLEWMRAEWMREEQPIAAVRMFLDPAQALRDLAPVYKRLEPDAEAVFWRSRYARP